MARVNAFIEAGNEHRDVSIGGRRGNSRVWARLNTDNAGRDNCALRVEARVHGLGLNSKERRKGDERKTTFHVELPEPDKHCSIVISTSRSGRSLTDELEPRTELEHFVARVDEESLPEFIRGEVERLKNGLGHVPEVKLPDGVDLRHALACVEIVRRLEEGDRNGR